MGSLGSITSRCPGKGACGREGTLNGVERAREIGLRDSPTHLTRSAHRTHGTLFAGYDPALKPLFSIPIQSPSKKPIRTLRDLLDGWRRFYYTKLIRWCSKSKVCRMSEAQIWGQLCAPCYIHAIILNEGCQSSYRKSTPLWLARVIISQIRLTSIIPSTWEKIWQTSDLTRKRLRDETSFKESANEAKRDITWEQTADEKAKNRSRLAPLALNRPNSASSL